MQINNQIRGENILGNTTANKQVSFDDEMLILVNQNDEVLGHKDKAACHNGEGTLHRAFSVFIFNEKGELLLQKRSAQKALWPLYWSNSCCSHPRKGEKIETSTLRRIREELGFHTDLKFLFKFQYQASYQDVGSENELCSVYIGKTTKPVSANRNEIEEWKFTGIDELEQELAQHPEDFTPWFKMEWERLRKEYWEEVERLWEADRDTKGTDE